MPKRVYELAGGSKDIPSLLALFQWDWWGEQHDDIRDVAYVGLHLQDAPLQQEFLTNSSISHDLMLAKLGGSDLVHKGAPPI